jgi:uncharacterized hydrophobic protein (TIGR00271 family)
MTDHVTAALFVYTDNTSHVIERMEDNPFGTRITAIAFDTLIQEPETLLKNVDHVVVAGSLTVLKAVLHLAMEYHFSVGILPTETQKDLVKFYDLPQNLPDSIDLALRRDAQPIDMILCNGKIILFKATIGRIPLLDAPARANPLSLVVRALKTAFQLKLFTFEFLTKSGQEIMTAASGCMILQHGRGSFASRLISHEHSLTDGMVSMVISAPISVAGYFRLLLQSLKTSKQYKHLPGSVGYIKSPQIDIEAEPRLDVVIDEQQATVTPLHCEAVAQCVKVNIGDRVRQEIAGAATAGERIDIDNLPAKNELLKAKLRKRIPFFSYASAERFRDLLAALREDARITPIYVVLMVVSTMLATVGLYLDNASVIIGAMLLAPLMAPIVSLSMGILRGEIELIQKSTGKIIVGICIVLMSSALISFLFPDKPVTGEMQARLNPTLLDLAVAIISGIAAAYSMSFKEIIQSLAGVAIAVALVPPLSVAGTGLGRLDFHFFQQAFLLFATNLVGIVIAARYTFTVLGYSAVGRSRRSIWIVYVLLALISVPLYFSYHRIVEDRVFEKSWQHERFLINEKYLIISKADMRRQADKRVIIMDVLARELLTRDDLQALKKKIQENFDEKLIIRVNTIYIP